MVMNLPKWLFAPKYQGLKIGQKLMNRCISYAKEQNWLALILYSNTRLKPAIRLYKKVGFKEIPLPKNNPYLRSDIKMQMELFPILVF